MKQADTMEINPEEAMDTIRQKIEPLDELSSAILILIQRLRDNQPLG